MKDWIPSTSAFTRVHSPSKTGVNALNDALCAGMNGEIQYVPFVPAKAGTQIRSENLFHAAASASATGSTMKRYLRPRASVAHQPSRSSSQP